MRLRDEIGGVRDTWSENRIAADKWDMLIGMRRLGRVLVGVFRVLAYAKVNRTLERSRRHHALDLPGIGFLGEKRRCVFHRRLSTLRKLKVG